MEINSKFQIPNSKFQISDYLRSQIKLLLFKTAEVFLVFFATLFILELFRRQDGGARARPKLVFSDSYLVFLLFSWHEKHYTCRNAFGHSWRVLPRCCVDGGLREGSAAEHVEHALHRRRVGGGLTPPNFSWGLAFGHFARRSSTTVTEDNRVAVTSR